MKIFVWLSIFSLASSFSPRPSQRPPSSVSSSGDDNDDSTRRDLVLSVFTGAVVWAVPAIAKAGLLDDYGTDPSKIVEKPKTAKASAPAAGSVPAKAIDPTLRSSYYYPTAKKRYLPRIQKVTEEIVRMPEAIAAQDWVAVADFGKVADNAVLPLQLYVSSLDGQGLSMANSYAKQMKVDALDYEKAYKLFVKALKIQNGDQILQAVTAMGVAVADYRIVGHLSDDDGNLPSVDEMRRMAMRRPTMAQPSAFK